MESSRLDWVGFVAYQYAGFLMGVAVLGSVFLGAAWLLDRIPMRRSAADRHAVWWLALFASVALPLTSLVWEIISVSLERSWKADVSAAGRQPARAPRQSSVIAEIPKACLQTPPK